MCVLFWRLPKLDVPFVCRQNEHYGTVNVTSKHSRIPVWPNTAAGLYGYHQINSFTYHACGPSKFEDQERKDVRMRTSLAMMSSLRNGMNTQTARSSKVPHHQVWRFFFAFVMTKFIKALEMQSAKDKVDFDENVSCSSKKVSAG